MPAAVLVPIKAFSAAKARLAEALSPEQRVALARSMATRVVLAAHDLPVHVVCDDAEVAEWAHDLGATVVWAPGTGLNGAVRAGIEALAAAGIDRVVVAHGDLPRARDLTWLADGDDVVLVPDRRSDGTNVLAMPTSCGLEPAYGPGSFRRHLHAAVTLGLAVRVVRDRDLEWDVDLPADLGEDPWTSPDNQH